MRWLLPFALLLVFGCGDSAPKPGVVSSTRTEPPPPVPAPGTAVGAGKQFKPGWSIAFWDEEQQELVIGFLESEPTAEALEKIKEEKNVFFGAGNDPYVEVGVTFEIKNGVPDIAALYRIFYSGFRNEIPHCAWTFAEYAEISTWDVQITGDPTSGGQVKGRFAGAADKLSENDHYYGWNLSFDLPVH